MEKHCIFFFIKIYDANQKKIESSINFNITILNNEIKNDKNLNLK